MPATNLLAVGNSEATSATFVVPANGQKMIWLIRGANGPMATGANVQIQIQGSNGNWTTIGRVRDSDTQTVIRGVDTDLTYRLYRAAGGPQVGADRS